MIYLTKFPAPMKTICLAGVSCLLFSSCASIVSKRDYPVSINSNPSGCKVLVKKSDGTVLHQGVTPTTVVLSAGGGYFKPASYDLEFTRKGGGSQTIPVKAGLDGWYIGNVVFGGLIGFLIVDPLTGAMWKLEPTVQAELTPLAVIDSGNGRRMTVVDRSAVPAHLKDQLVALR